MWKYLFIFILLLLLATATHTQLPCPCLKISLVTEENYRPSSSHSAWRRILELRFYPILQVCPLSCKAAAEEQRHAAENWKNKDAYTVQNRWLGFLAARGRLWTARRIAHPLQGPNSSDCRWGQGISCPSSKGSDSPAVGRLPWDDQCCSCSQLSPPNSPLRCSQTLGRNDWATYIAIGLVYSIL